METYWLQTNLLVPVNSSKGGGVLLENLSSVAIINKFLHGASHYGWANSPGATGVQKNDQ